jgi:ATP-dependent Lon protease
VLLSRENEKDVQEIKPEHLLSSLKIQYVDTLEDVLAAALEEQVAENALQLVPQSNIGLRVGS